MARRARKENFYIIKSSRSLKNLKADLGVERPQRIAPAKIAKLSPQLMRKGGLVAGQWGACL